MAVTDFFQSPEFGGFQEQIPSRGKTWILKVKKTGSSCLVIRQVLKKGCMFWIPYGPLLTKGHENDNLKTILKDLSLLAKEEGAIFCRIEPLIELSKFGHLDFTPKKSFERYTPSKTLVLDLFKTETELLSGMKEKGRYNIRLAEKHGVTIQQFHSQNEVGAHFAFTEFYRLLQKTSSRDKFGHHPESFYKTFLEFFGQKNMASLFVAQYEGKIIGGIIVVFYGDTAIYYYGASDYEHRHLMAPYLLQWKAALEAKKRGMRWYDLFGLEWGRVSEFKEKFGGEMLEFPKAFDIVYRPFWYWMLKLKRKFLP